MDANLFDEGILDSMGSVQLLLELQKSTVLKCPFPNLNVLNETPAKIVAKVASLQ